jgi:alkylation response protein AidB-like acyl-CoA dehydrogenase
MLTLPEELEFFRRSVRERAEAKIAALIPAIDRSGAFSADLWSELRAAEIIRLPFAQECGGLGGSFLSFAVAIEELARVGAIAGLYPGTTVQVIATIMAYGTSQQKEKWLPALLDAEAPAAWAFTEPQTGSDPTQIETTARRCPDGWELNGQKTFISYARQAWVALVFARLDESGLGAFLVETSQPGYAAGKPVEVLGLAGTEAAPIYLERVLLPDEAMIGQPGDGFGVMLAGENQGKVRASAINVGIATRAVEEAARYAAGRLHRGVAIGEKFATVQTLLGEMEAQVQSARAFTRTVAQQIDVEGGSAKMSAAARIVTGRCAREVTSSALQVCGAYGWTKDLPLERLYREAKFFEVTQGVAEMQKIIVARALLSELESAQQ